MTFQDHIRKAGWHLRQAGLVDDDDPRIVKLTGFWPTSDLNDIIRDLSDNRGGLVLWSPGAERSVKVTEPIVLRPGVELRGVGVPSIYSKHGTVLRPEFSHAPVFQLLGQQSDGSREAWGGSAVRRFGVDSVAPGLTLVELNGGNDSLVEDITSSSSTRLARIVHVPNTGDAGRYDGQYSTFRRVRVTRAYNGVVASRGFPDTVFEQCKFYGNIRDDQGYVSGAGVEFHAEVGQLGNIEFNNCHVQFWRRGWHLNAHGITVRDGSFENHSDAKPEDSEYIVRLGTRARDIIFDGVSFENLHSVDRGFVFDDPPDALRNVGFIHPTGHTDVLKSKIPAGYERFFRFLPSGDQV